MTKQNTFDLIREFLLSQNWIEQRDGVTSFNGERATNFGKDGVVLGLSENDFIDEEEYDEMFYDKG
jgi:hypothetical protein